MEPLILTPLEASAWPNTLGRVCAAACDIHGNTGMSGISRRAAPPTVRSLARSLKHSKSFLFHIPAGEAHTHKHTHTGAALGQRRVSACATLRLGVPAVLREPTEVAAAAQLSGLMWLSAVV